MNRPIFGNPATTPNPVSDFNQNNPKKADYIKNRPCYEIEGVLGSVDGINETQIPSPVSVGSEIKVTFAIDSGLNFDARIKLQDGVTEYRCCVDCVKVVFDGMWLNVYNVSNEHDLSYTGTITVSQITVKTLGEKFIPDTIARNADIPIYKGDGEYSATVGTENEALGIASFVAGKGNKVTDKYGVALGRATQAGYAAHAEGMENTADDYAHAEGRETHAKGRFSHTQGYQTEAVGEASHAQGYRTTAKANYTHTEGKETTATSSAAHAQGANTEANGVVSHAQGQSSIADGDCSHAQGHTTKAVGFCSHSQGRLTEAIGENSDACGYKTIAKGKNSHTGGESCVTEEDATNAFVEGFNNTNRAPRAFIAGGQWNSTSNNAEDSFVYGIGSSASAVAQKVGGKFPITDPKYAEIVGNGKSSSARSNAYTLDWDGNACFSGSVECNGIIMKSPSGTRYKITVSDNGTLTTTKM